MNLSCFRSIPGISNISQNNITEVKIEEFDAKKNGKTDLKIDSLYNTYKYNGLPPGAISSVGYESLYAAFHPDEGNALYFVSKKDGSHAFASNYEDHRDNIKRYSNNI